MKRKQMGLVKKKKAREGGIRKEKGKEYAAARREERARFSTGKTRDGISEATEAKCGGNEKTNSAFDSRVPNPGKGKLSRKKGAYEPNGKERTR